MAGRFDKALGNTVIKQVADTSKKDANVPKIEYIDIDKLDENPDNKEIFNMEDIKTIARSIEDNGFTGAIEVFKKSDGRYEISSGHRRVRAMRELGRDKVPCIVSTMPNDIVRARKLLESNITNRTLHPLDYARSIEYYIANVLKPSGYEGDMNKKSAEFFNISSSSVYKYRQIVKMIPELQELANDPQFPYSGFVSAHRLSEEKQHELYDEIKNYSQNHKSEDGSPIEVSRFYIEQTVRKLLKEEDRYKEAQNEKIREASLRKAQERENADKASEDIKKVEQIPPVEAMPAPAEDLGNTSMADMSPLPLEDSGATEPASPFDNITEDKGEQQESGEADFLSELPDGNGMDIIDPFNDNASDFNRAPDNLNVYQAEVFQKINAINLEVDRIQADMDRISDTSRLKDMLISIKDKIDSIIERV